MNEREFHPYRDPLTLSLIVGEISSIGYIPLINGILGLDDKVFLTELGILSLAVAVTGTGIQQRRSPSLVVKDLLRAPRVCLNLIRHSSLDEG